MFAPMHAWFILCLKYYVCAHCASRHTTDNNRDISADLSWAAVILYYCSSSFFLSYLIYINSVLISYVYLCGFLSHRFCNHVISHNFTPQLFGW